MIFESESDVSIEYIPNSKNKFKVRREYEEIVFESNEAKMQFNIPHNLGVTPIVQLWTKDNLNDKYQLTFSKFDIDEENISVDFNYPVYCKIIFKV